MIKATGLTKTYKKKKAVDDLSFNVELGKVTGFLGPNGAGKSTTMRLMLGLDNGGGETLFDGKKLNMHDKLSSVVGVLLEAKAFHPSRSARNHLRILAAAGSIPDRRVELALDLVGLKDVAKNKPGKFSLGMSQRLGIAAAILGKPKYLLLDEPANGLDPEGIAWLRQFIKDYADAGNAVFVSSHLLSEMAQMADNVIVIGKGRMIADTSIDELVSGSAHTSIFVRSNNQFKLAKVIKEKAATMTKSGDGLKISGIKTDEVGEMAFQAGIIIHELTNRSASLEEVFLELTSDSQEYHAGKKVKP